MPVFGFFGGNLLRLANRGSRLAARGSGSQTRKIASPSCDRSRHVRKLKITFPSEVSVPSNKRPYRTLTFHKVLARQGSPFGNRASLNFQAFALCDTEVAAQEDCRVGEKMSYRFSFC